jgi:hypothetical protein
MVTRALATRILVGLAAAAAVGATITGCSSFDNLRAGPDPVVTPSPTASATPTGSATAAAVTIPGDCASLVLGASPNDFTKSPLNSTGVVEAGRGGAIKPVQPPAGATPAKVLADAVQLNCVWRDPQADISGLSATVATVDPAVATTFMATLPAQGYTCGPVHSGTQCQLIGTDSEYKVPTGRTYFLRDNTYVTVIQANTSTHDLIGTMVTNMWGSATAAPTPDATTTPTP